MTTTTPGLKRLRKSAKAETVRKATLADQKVARAAAKARAAATTPIMTKKPTTDSLRERKLRRLAKDSPYRPGTGLAKMAALVVDGMTVSELTAAMRKAGMKQSQSGFVGNAVARKFLAVE